jgi:hypothetical protein
VLSEGPACLANTAPQRHGSLRNNTKFQSAHPGPGWTGPELLFLVVTEPIPAHSEILHAYNLHGEHGLASVSGMLLTILFVSRLHVCFLSFLEVCGLANA